MRIVATDIDKKGIKVFSKEATVGHPGTPNIAVADAVAASIAVPLIFSPKVIDAGRLLDGGLVSNLPMLLFDEERLERPDLPTVAFSLAADETELHGGGDTAAQFLGRVARSAIFGGQSVGRRAIDNLVVVDVPAGLELMDFDVGWEQVTRVYQRAREATVAQLAQQLIDRREEMNDLCRIIHGYLDDRFKALPEAVGKAPNRRLRVNIAQKASPKYLRVRYSHNMASDTDDHVLLPIERSISGEAWRKRDIRCIAGKENMSFRSHPLADDKYRAALIWKDLESVISVPIFKAPTIWYEPILDQRPEPIGILNIDANRSLERLMAESEIIDFLRQASNIVVTVISRLGESP